jgi:hypothetical protein
MSARSPEDKSSPPAEERRATPERRKRTLRALFMGSLTPRRRGLRRDTDAGIVAVDWHESHWLAVAILIVILSCADAFLTLTLIADGAYEVNPVMASFLEGSPWGFALAKIGFTSLGVVLLTALARARAFGRFSVGLALYTVLFAYTVLVAYECWLCDHCVLGP